ncbi:hypothetical protein ABOM_006125 [Aspergillus bombycis]|uniref:Amine oxidase domain-containing protein n=1 Tax=Aspergillus bombycis TaxID=109264 RepID=A0A1F7ZZK2_9EURO|nr:hypothetical protein ABOM_006125 [Aspergillus bombycis]OGM44890.1 hypothetical protein ABOM_006125 [Aspergillus bombycis]
MTTRDSRPPKRVAIVGGGIAGIACLWGLRDSNYEVHLYEADDRLGGHANSVPFHGNGIVRDVDTAFVVTNEESYPQFSAFIKALGVETIATDMSFSVSDSDGFRQWGSASFWSFVGCFSNLFRPWFWRLVFDIVRFNHFATDILHEKAECSKSDELESIGEYLTRQRYSRQFKRYYLIPMVAAPWCLDPEEAARTFPAETLIRFMSQHRVLDTLTHKLQWRSFGNGSKSYIEAFVREMQKNHHLHLGTTVQSVTRNPDSHVSIITRTGVEERFDRVVLAVHAEIALQMLGDEISTVEADVLGAFETSRTVCVLHSDETVLPQRPSARLSWNCILRSPHACRDHFHPVTRPSWMASDVSGFSVTYDLNRLQAIPGPGEEGSLGRVLVTMNPMTAPGQARSWHLYRHPKITSKSVRALKRLHLLRTGGNVSFAGAWMGYGFHEDGFVAGLQVAKEIIGGDCDTFADVETTEEECRPTWTRYLVRGIVRVVQGLIERMELPWLAARGQ